MGTLYDLINNELKNSSSIKYNSLDEFITDDKRSAEFIMSLSEGIKFKAPDAKSDLYNVAQARARHSAIIYLFGSVIINNIDGLKELTLNDEYFDSIWLLASLNHDIGYTLKDLLKGDTDYRLKYKNYLLRDKYEEKELQTLNGFFGKYSRYFAYTYEEIEAYDLYAREFHSRRPDYEKVDHGILGGVYLFDKKIRYCIKEKKPEYDYIITKAAAITIAQHNIFKSPNAENDNKYPRSLAKLYSTSRFKINKDTLILLILSLIDTVDCIKRFSKNNNSGISFRSITVLKGIELTFYTDSIIISFVGLNKRILENEKKNEANGKELRLIFDTHMTAIESLGSWTTYRVEKMSEYTYKLYFEI